MYLGSGTVRDTKHNWQKLPWYKASSSSADEFNSPSLVVAPDSSSQPSDTDSEPKNMPPTPSKPPRGWPRKPKARIVKEKTQNQAGMAYDLEALYPMPKEVFKPG